MVRLSVKRQRLGGSVYNVLPSINSYAPPDTTEDFPPNIAMPKQKLSSSHITNFLSGELGILLNKTTRANVLKNKMKSLRSS